MLYKLDFKPDTCFAFKGWNAYENAKDISRTCISRMTFQKFKQRQGGTLDVFSIRGNTGQQKDIKFCFVIYAFQSLFAYRPARA